MPITAANFDRFLRIVHRRLRVLRFVEHIGLGIVISAAFAIVMVGLLAWRGAPLLIPSLCCLALGTLGGWALGIARRPTVLDAAMEADRQLGLADLLGSALLVRDVASADPWAASVVVTADARCADLSPSLVLLHRLGLRAWGGIGLAMALVLTIALLAGNPSNTRAENLASQLARATNPVTPARPEHPLLDLTVAGASGSLIPRKDVQDEISNRSGENSLPTPNDSNAKDQDIRESDANSRAASIASPNDHGGGAGRTDVHPPATDAQHLHAPSGEAPNAAGRVTAGVGTPDSEHALPGVETAAGVDAAAAPAAMHVPPWQSDQWQVEVRRAHQAIDSGQIPAAYQGLVRDYFDRER